jgi:hypothetical protein
MNFNKPVVAVKEVSNDPCPFCGREQKFQQPLNHTALGACYQCGGCQALLVIIDWDPLRLGAPAKKECPACHQETTVGRDKCDRCHESITNTGKRWIVDAKVAAHKSPQSMRLRETVAKQV